MELVDEDSVNKLVSECDFCINCNSVLLQETSKVCKVFRSNGSLNPVTESSESTGKSEKGRTSISLATAISKTLHIDILKSEKYFLCDKCGRLLEMAYNVIRDFMELTRRGSVLEQKLKEITREKIAKAKGLIKKKKRRKIRSKSKVDKNKEKVSIQDKSSYYCDFCEKAFSSEEFLSKHKLQFHSNKIHGPTDAKAVPLYRCSICDVECHGIDDFHNHLKIHEDEEESRGCQATKAGLEDDEEEDDLILGEKLKCKLCDSGYCESISQLKSHYTKEHPLVSILTLTDRFKLELEDQNEIAKNDALIVEDDVEKSNVENQNLNLKQNGISKGRFVFNCNVCHKQFLRHDHIKLHLRIHTGEKPFICKVENCEKAFSDPRGLAYHEITHSNERPYCCKFCGMTFKRLHHLNDHEKNHNDVPRRFVCQFCNKAFKHRKHLNSHSVIHQGTKEHQCSFCFKAFNRKDNLRQHIKKVHNEKPASLDDDSNKIKTQAKSRRKRLNTSVDELNFASTVCPDAIVFPTTEGTPGAATIIASGNSSILNNVIIPQLSSSSSASCITPVLKGSTSTSTVPMVAVTTAFPAIIDQQIVYMPL